MLRGCLTANRTRIHWFGISRNAIIVADWTDSKTGPVCDDRPPFEIAADTRFHRFVAFTRVFFSHAETRERVKNVRDIGSFGWRWWLSVAFNFLAERGRRVEISRRMCSRQVCFVDDTKLEFSSLFHWYFVCDTCLYCNSWEGVIATKYSDINPWCFPFERSNRTIRRQIFLIIDLLLSRVRLQLDLCF